jgi:hypothetical protein
VINRAANLRNDELSHAVCCGARRPPAHRLRRADRIDTNVTAARQAAACGRTFEPENLQLLLKALQG